MASVTAAAAVLAGCAQARPTLEDVTLPEPTVDPVEDLADGATGTTVVTADGCRAAPIPPDADPGTTVDIVVDEATAGSLRVHRDAGGHWRIRVETADGDSVDAPLQVDLATDPDAGVIAPLGATDLDGDGERELFSVVGDASGAALVTIHVLTGCALGPVTVGGGSLSFPVGAPAGLINGLACSDTDGDGRIDGITGWIGLPDGTGPDGTPRLRLDGVTYLLDGTELTQVATVSESGLDAAAAAAYGVLACPDLPRPGP